MRGSVRRALLTLAIVVLLLVAVAVASTGSVPGGTGGTRRPSASLVDALVSLYLLLMVVGAGLWVYVFVAGKNALAEAVTARRSRSPWQSLIRLALGFGLLALVVDRLAVDDSLRRRFGRILSQPTGPGGSSAVAGHPGGGSYEPRFAAGPVLVVVVLLAVAGGAWYLSHRARRRELEPGTEALLPALTEVLGETLDDLRAERDPRRAVIAAYARMERALASYGFPRRPTEAPDEYLQRIFTDLDVSRRATSRLTALFSWAKFSGQDVAPEMKQEAIEALEALREELGAAEILAEHERLTAFEEHPERRGA